MDGRYEVFATHGKGVFSTVLRARDLKTENGTAEVAIKIIRANETMYKAAQTEKVPHFLSPACCIGMNQCCTIRSFSGANTYKYVRITPQMPIRTLIRGKFTANTGHLR